ncbi:hypothetical protein C8J56DRAFT_884107 [Mycena floridula]|nr:hypothetical protein C8J56DRAFT_884107 [Mycena floridula]
MAWDQPIIQRHDLGTLATIRAKTVLQQRCRSKYFMLLRHLHRYIGILTAHLDDNGVFTTVTLSAVYAAERPFQRPRRSCDHLGQDGISTALALDVGLQTPSRGDNGNPTTFTVPPRDRNFDTHPDDNGIFTTTARSLLDVAEGPSQRHGHLEMPSRQQRDIGAFAIIRARMVFPQLCMHDRLMLLKDPHSDIGILTRHPDDNDVLTTVTLSPAYVAERPLQRHGHFRMPTRQQRYSGILTAHLDDNGVFTTVTLSPVYVAERPLQRHGHFRTPTRQQRYSGILTAHLDDNGVFTTVTLSPVYVAERPLQRHGHFRTPTRQQRYTGILTAHLDDNGVFTTVTLSPVYVAERPLQRHGHFRTPTRQQRYTGILTAHLDDNGVFTTVTLSPVYVAERPLQRHGHFRTPTRQQRYFRKPCLYDRLMLLKDLFKDLGAPATIRAKMVSKQPCLYLHSDMGSWRGLTGNNDLARDLGAFATILPKTVFLQLCLYHRFMLLKGIHTEIGISTPHLDGNGIPQHSLFHQSMLLKELHSEIGIWTPHPHDNGTSTTLALYSLLVAERPLQRPRHFRDQPGEKGKFAAFNSQRPHVAETPIQRHLPFGTPFTRPWHSHSPEWPWCHVAEASLQRDRQFNTPSCRWLHYSIGQCSNNKKRQEKSHTTPPPTVASSQKSNLFDVLTRQRKPFAASAAIKSSQIVQMPTKMIFFDANRIRYSLTGVLERQEDEVLPMLKRPSEQSRAWVETIHQLLSPDFPFDDPAHLPTVQIQFEPGTKDYIGYAMKIDFVSCSYCGYSNILTIKPTVFGSKTFANAVHPHSQDDYEEKVGMVVDTLKKHLDVAQTLGNQRDKFDKAMKDIQASLKAHLDSRKNNNGHTWTDIREFTENKFEELRKMHRAGGTDGSISLKRKSQAQPIGQQRKKMSSASTSSKARPAAPRRSQAAPRIQFVRRLPKTLTELLNEASGPGTSLWQFEQELEDKYGFDSEATLACMQKKSHPDLIDTFNYFQLISDEYKLANASELTFLVDAMLTLNMFPVD